MDSNSTRNCRLCQETSDNLLNIYENYMRSITIAEILSQHFWFQVDKNDGLSEWLCEMCWLNVKTFHNFYKKIEHRHGNKWKSIKMIDLKSIKQEPTDSPSEAVLDPDFLKQTDGPGEAVEEPDLNIVKCEETQLTAVYIFTSKEDTCDYINENRLDQSEIMEAKDDEDRPSNAKSKNDDIGGDRNDNSTCEQSKCEIMEALDDDDCPSGSQSTTKECKNSSYSTQQEKDEQDAQIRQYFTMKCEICDEVEFKTILEVRRHYRRVHNKNGYLVCCGKRYRCRHIILQHIVYHTKPDAHRCDQCNKNFKDKQALQQHMGYHVPARSLKCSQCSRRFTTAATLNYHVRDKHLSDKGETFSCDICSKSFSSKLSIASHIRGVHRASFEHVCEICARQFKTRLLLEDHIAYVHSKTTPPKVKCDICGVWFKHESNLRKHQKHYHDTQNVEEEIQCSICNKVMQNKRKLRSHVRAVHGDRWHKCVLCDKALKTAISLKEHMALHTGEDLYSCAYCEKKFKSNGNMFAHRKKAHAAEWTRDHAKRRQNNESEQELRRGTEQVETKATKIKS